MLRATSGSSSTTNNASAGDAEASSSRDQFVQKAFRLFDPNDDGFIEMRRVEEAFVDGRAGAEVVRLLEAMDIGGKGVTWEELEAHRHTKYEIASLVYITLP